MKFWLFIGLSIVVHVILFASIFDIYFKSPLVHGMQEYLPSVKPPSSRLVLFVGDGLRADKFFELDENGKTRAPYLRNIIEKEGTWGVSHTRVPTESRPGHVALIAGFYEDVSAILKGWKKNPVEFDSVFNKSKSTYSWGSADILPMFSEGAGPHVHINCFSPEIVNFAGNDSSLLDTWVFDEVDKFFESAKENETLKQQLSDEKIVFFLHLLGIDTNGHSHKPMSKEYLSNIRLVDEGVKRIVQIIEDFYKGDGQTSYVFTSDHGMTDWGSHGAGLPSETLTPLVVWGSGATKHVQYNAKLEQSDIDLTRSWGLDPTYQVDVNQADIAPLMSLLLGLPVPVNSVGVLPVHYLSVDLESKCKLLLANAQQIAEQFIVKLKMTKQKSLFFSPFLGLSDSEVTDMTRKIIDFISAKKYDQALTLSYKLINLSLQGLQYYHTYHRLILSLSVALSFLGWMAVSLCTVLQQVSFIQSQVEKMKPTGKKSHPSSLFYAFVVFGICICVNLYMSQVPLSSYLYCLLPLPIWYYIVTQQTVFQVCWTILKGNKPVLKGIFIYACIGLMGTWSLVLSFFYRHILSAELLVFAFLFVKLKVTSVKYYAAVMCFILSLFPMLPVVGRSPNAALLVCAGGLGALLCYISSRRISSRALSLLSILPFTCGIMSPLALYMSSVYGEVSMLIHVVSWVTLLGGWFIPIFQSTKLWHRMLCIYVCHCSTYLLISLSYDGLFCITLCILLALWTRVEFEISEVGSGQKMSKLDELDFTQNTLELGDSTEHQELSFHTTRRCYMLLFFAVLSFFGVGNIASINSFDNSVVLPFITVFNHTIMGALLAYKVLLPYFLVVCTFCSIAVATKTHFTQLCCFVLMISDLMSIHFFYLVQDEGSWLDIGTSISHYIITMTMIISILFFLAGAKFLTSFKINHCYLAFSNK